MTPKEVFMKTKQFLIIFTLAVFFAGCATMPPNELAYTAQRKAEKAGAVGALAADKASKDNANANFQKKQTEIVKQGKQDLRDSEKQATAARAELDKRAAVEEVKDKANAEIVEQGKQNLRDSEQRTADARAELARLAVVKEEKRGLVVTLSG